MMIMSQPRTSELKILNTAATNLKQDVLSLDLDLLILPPALHLVPGEQLDVLLLSVVVEQLPVRQSGPATVRVTRAQQAGEGEDDEKKER